MTESKSTAWQTRNFFQGNSKPVPVLFLLLLPLVLILILPFAYAQQSLPLLSEDITIKEWDIPTPNSSPHDVVVGNDGTVWFTEIGANKIGSFDPTTEEFKEWDIPTPNSRPHGLAVDSSGSVWFTEVGASKIGKLDPTTGVIDEFDTPTANSGPHTPIFADQNTLWFTEQRASQIGRMNIETSHIDEFPTPTSSTVPYGITIDTDGNAWFAELGGHNIGKVDAITGNVTEFSPPTEQSGPRRISIDSNGTLWFTQYNAGKIASFDPTTETMTEYATSSEASGPYAIWVDKFDNVWFSMTGTYKMGVFDQESEKIIEYDMPTPQTHIKFIRTDSDGNVWFPNYNKNKIGALITTAQGTDKSAAEKKPSGTADKNEKVAHFLPPLKQIKAGTKPSDVTCTEGLELVLKSSDGSPACIKPSSVSKLIERGWAIHVLPDYQEGQNNNSVIFETGDLEVITTTVEYHPNSSGYLAEPSEDGDYPAVVMIHEWWGLNENIKEMAEKLASHGYVVLAVDLYEGQVATTSEEARQLRSSYNQKYWTNNMNSAVLFLQNSYNPAKIGSIGWCFGGGQSLNLALNNQNLDATVVYYGQPVTDPQRLSSVKWPILGIFAQEDMGIPVDTVRQFEGALDEAGVENDIIIYPDVDHAFANPSGDRYAPQAAQDAWQKTLAFFAKNLKP